MDVSGELSALTIIMVITTTINIIIIIVISNIFWKMTYRLCLPKICLTLPPSLTSFAVVREVVQLRS
jgi:hypothetical protein